MIVVSLRGRYAAVGNDVLAEGQRCGVLQQAELFAKDWAG